MNFCKLYIFLVLLIKLVKSKTNCTCVPYYQCSDDLKTTYLDGGNILDLRQYAENKCTGEFDVCCENNKESDILSDKPEKPQGCGYQNTGLLPWSVSIHYQKSVRSISQYICGGSLIHPKAVVTAAHCINNKSLLWFVKTGNQQRIVRKMLKHPEYNSINMVNDVALIILRNPFRMDNRINPICIPPPGILFDETNCLVGLWKNNVYSSTIPYIFKLELPIVSRDRCVNSLRNTRLGKHFQLHNNFLCAGGESNRDACIGDGGNSLVCPIANQPGRFHQAGIVSWGIGCGTKNVPGVYVNLAKYRPWIDEKIISYGLDILTYRY